MQLPETRTFSSLIKGGGGGGDGVEADTVAGGSKMTASCSGALHSVRLGMEISMGALISVADITKISEFEKRKIDCPNPM